MNEFFTMILTLSATFLLAGFVKGVTGMGLPTVAMGVLGSIMSPAAAAAFLLIPALVTNIWQLVAGPAFNGIIRRLWPVMLASAIATICSAGLLISVDLTGARLALGLTLIMYAVYALVAPVWVVSPEYEKWLGPLLGLMTGVMTGLTGVFAIPVVPYLQALRLEKDTLVQALGLSFTVSSLALGVGLALRSGLPMDGLGFSAYAIVPSLLGMWLGQWFRSYISARAFKVCFLVFLMVLGLEMCVRALVMI